MTNASARLLKGRKIVGFDPRKFQGRRGVSNPRRYRQAAHDPIIELDNGAFLTFTVEETDSGEYGVCVNYHPKRSQE